jgi:hypothetical protein
MDKNQLNIFMVSTPPKKGWEETNPSNHLRTSIYGQPYQRRQHSTMRREIRMSVKNMDVSKVVFHPLPKKVIKFYFLSMLQNND